MFNFCDDNHDKMHVKNLKLINYEFYDMHKTTIQITKYLVGDFTFFLSFFFNLIRAD